MEYQSFSNIDVNKVIFLSDIHFGLRGNSIEWNQNLIDYFDNFFLPLLIKESQNGKPAIIIAGDYFDNRQAVDINVMNTAMDIMNKITDICPVYMIIGNHDIYKKSDTDITSLRVFERNDKVNIVRHQGYLELANDTKFLLVSWVGDPKTETEIINKSKSGCSAIILHTEISGMGYDNGRPIINGVDPTAIGDFTIISGHIHTKQHIHTDTADKIYLGAPFQCRRSDIGNERGIFIYDINSDGNTLRFIPNDYSPKFIKIPYQRFIDESAPKEFVAYKPTDKKSVYHEIHNNYVDVIVTPEQAKNINPTKFVDDLSQFEPRNIEIVIDKTVKLDESKEEIEVSDDMTITDVFSKRVAQLGLKVNEIRTLEDMNKMYINQAENN